MDAINELLTRGVDKIYPSKEELEKILRSGKKLKLYQGFDPTGTQLHIGHMVGLRKLRQWQDLGHKVIFLIGDFTAMIGDPSDKDSTRTPLTHEQVMNNAKTYKDQVSKILGFNGENPVQMKFNNEWLGKMTLSDFLKLAGNITHSQLVERDMFKNRIKKGKDVYISELLYPLLQAYDCVEMNVDVELGATDQTFNMLMGRKLMRNMKQKEKFVMTTPLLTDAKGQKIGKTEGNVIALTDTPNELFGKIMSLSDDVIVRGFEYLTDVKMDDIKQIGEDLKGGKNPITYKKKLAFEIVKQLNDHNAAHKAQEDFEKKVQNKEQSLEIPVVNYKSGVSLAKIAIDESLVASNSEWKRLINQGGIKKDNEQLKNPGEVLSDKEIILQKGRKSIKIKPI